ncbi:hypothetical protein [Nocardia terpenica]|uniref:Uncharacterized protein n=1 Tax=Nocardia terpenica TaxID=455432 RepID=A0A6G9Z1F3_9NOCA|nr:hypothetical protein [Nocardia terpenica]QIS19284.1 hypothetical protein F6W96_14325 [Nocardia terpenica]
MHADEAPANFTTVLDAANAAWLAGSISTLVRNGFQKSGFAVPTTAPGGD